MTDLRDFTANIRSTVKENTFRDHSYRWSVKAIRKDTIELNWSYLDPKDGCFTIRVLPGIDGEQDALKVFTPGICPIANYITVGADRWSDACDMSHAVVVAIRCAFNLAHHYY